ncbi:MAG: hypothetical protein LPK04_04490, partial [Caulobacteraceae bacterium]|nr:hypothetical protein [Caulobacteraceae bacterium]
EAIDLHADCREALGLWRVGADGERKALRYRTPLMLPRASGAGAPRFWTLEGEAIVLERPCAEETALILRRVVRLGLSEAEPTNPVLAEHPDLYLFGALAEAAPYLRDSEMAALFLGRFEMARAEARAADSRRHGRARLVCEPAALAKAVPC